MDNYISQNQAEKVKKVWKNPELEVLEVKHTKYWEFQMSDDGFWKNVWVDDLNSFS